jgi:hypothetical protein
VVTSVEAISPSVSFHDARNVATRPFERSPGNWSQRLEIKRATIQEVHRVEAAWLRIVGVLLIALGAVLFASPYISYSAREQLRNTPLSVKREKTFAVPRPIAVFIIAAGVTVLAIASRKAQR